MSEPRVEIHREDASISAGHAGFYFVVQGGNGEPVAWSEMYSTPDHAERGYEDLRAIVLSDPLVVRMQG